VTAPSGRNLHGSTTTILSALMIIIGAGLVIRTLSLGGGLLAIGVIMGVLFIAAGCGRLWVANRGPK
jgi:preprotein translocase subunit SecF